MRQVAAASATDRAPRRQVDMLDIPPIRLAGPSDIQAFMDHMVVHVAESGREGSPYFTISRTVNRDEMREALQARWTRDLDEPLWGRTWLLIHPTGRRVVGHLELRGGRMPGELHRALLGMGIERPFTAKGNGRRLIETAIAWARDTRRLTWIDLGVFANNTPARKLYARMGFVELGLRRDAFHVDDGVTVDDIAMTLRIE